MLTEKEYQKLSKDREHFVSIVDKYKFFAKDSIDSIFKIEVERRFNDILAVTYEILKNKLNKEDSLFKILFLEHEAIYCFMLKNNLKILNDWSNNEFLRSVKYPLKDLEV